MRILLWARPDDGLVGGDFIQVRRTAEALRRLGHWVEVTHNEEIYDDYLKSFDVIHLFILIMPWTPRHLEQIKRLNIPVVCSLLYRDPNYGE